MKTSTYLSELEKELSLLPKKQREEILKEINSYINESQASQQDVIKRFGEAKDLALSYLEDAPELQLKEKRPMAKIQKFFIALSIFSFALVIFAFFLFKYFTQDAFNYSKYNAKNIENKITHKWKNLENIKTINIHQGSAVFYWSEKNIFKYSCANENTSIKEKTLFVKQNACYFVLPKKLLHLAGFQADLTLIEPLFETAVKIEQAELRIEQHSKKYEFIFKKEQSSIQDLNSVKGNILIRIESYQAQVNKYEY